MAGGGMGSTYDTVCMGMMTWLKDGMSLAVLIHLANQGPDWVGPANESETRSELTVPRQSDRKR